MRYCSARIRLLGTRSLTAAERMETMNLFLAAGFAAPFEEGSEPDADDGELDDSHEAPEDPGEEA
nr:hypothetical protein [Tanacetum cinerariifolium]